ncbi:hypothetical protein L9F63_024737, partial [Diploptera punctata]
KSIDCIINYRLGIYDSAKTDYFSFKWNVDSLPNGKNDIEIQGLIALHTERIVQYSQTMKMNLSASFCKKICSFISCDPTVITRRADKSYLHTDEGVHPHVFTISVKTVDPVPHCMFDIVAAKLANIADHDRILLTSSKHLLFKHLFKCTLLWKESNANHVFRKHHSHPQLLSRLRVGQTKMYE